MKVITVCLILFAGSLYAQDFTSPNNFWKLGYEGYLNPAPEGDRRFGEEILINGMVYRQLERWDPDQSIWIPLTDRYWRDDINSDVYMVEFDPQTQIYHESLRYRFDVVKGDTIDVTGQKVVVKWITKSLQYADSIRLVGVGNALDSTDYNVWIEGGGGVFGTFSHEFEEEYGLGAGIRCYYRNDTLRLGSLDQDCEDFLMTLISITHSPHLGMYPNPAKTNCTIILPASFSSLKLGTLQLIDLQGSAIFQKTIDLSQSQIMLDIPDGVSGLHILRVLSSQGHLASGVLLIE